MRTGDTYMAYIAIVERAGSKAGFIGQSWDELMAEPTFPAAFAGTTYERPTVLKDRTVGLTEEDEAVGFYLAHLLSLGVH